jgi:hypothetical protein
MATTTQLVTGHCYFQMSEDAGHLTITDTAAVSAIKRGNYIAQYGFIDVALLEFPDLPMRRMTVLVFGWEGSGLPPDHHSLN